jgi:hypothetical protein
VSAPRCAPFLRGVKEKTARSINEDMDEQPKKDLWTDRILGAYALLHLYLGTAMCVEGLAMILTDPKGSHWLAILVLTLGQIVLYWGWSMGLQKS